MIVQVRLIADSKSEHREPGMIVRPPAEGPMVLSLARAMGFGISIHPESATIRVLTLDL